MISSGFIGLGFGGSRTTTYFQVVGSSTDKNGGRYRIRTIRTYDFHRVM
jgi:hypothetical protein